MLFGGHDVSLQRQQRGVSFADGLAAWDADVEDPHDAASAQQLSLVCLCCRNCFTRQVWSADIPALSWEPAQFKSQIRQSLSGQLLLLWCLLVFWMSACLSVHPPVCMFVCASIRLSLCQPAYLLVCLFNYVSGSQDCTTTDCATLHHMSTLSN